MIPLLVNKIGRQIDNLTCMYDLPPRGQTWPTKNEDFPLEDCQRAQLGEISQDVKLYMRSLYTADANRKTFSKKQKQKFLP